MEEFKKKKYIKVDIDLIIKALSPTEDPEQYHYEMLNKIFTLTKVEPLEDESYEIIYIRLPNLKKIELQEDALDVVLRQMEDFGIISEKCNQQSHLVTSLRGNYTKLNEQYACLVNEKDHLEEQIIEKCLELLNEKKKFINERLNEAYKNPNDSSFDMRDFVLNDGLRNSADESKSALKIEEISPIKVRKERFSPIASTSTAQTLLTTPKSKKQSTPLKHKRTPSKKLFAQTQEQDSDDFDVIPLANEKSLSPRKRKSTQQDTSSIFSNFKRTPKKPKCNREDKESSVELKMDKKTESHHDYISSSPVGSEKSVENAQRIEPEGANEKATSHSSDTTFKTAKNHDKEDLSQFTQAFDMDVDSPPILRKSQRNQKNPYSADTIDYLNM